MFYFIIGLLLFVIDQLTKVIADSNMVLGEPIPIIKGLFNLTLVYNKGAAFGMFSKLHDPWRQVVLWGVSLIGLVVIFFVFRKEVKADKWGTYALTLIVSGAFGNLIDRFRYDYVVDFLDFYVGSYHWPAFNIADSCISIGIVMLFFRILINEQKEKKAKKAN